MQMCERVRKKAEKHRGLFLIVFSLAIMLIYLGCECYNDFDGVSYYICPAFINGLMMLAVYLAWRSYMREHISVSVRILLSGIAIMLPFAVGAHGWFKWNWAEKVFEFVRMLWPVLLLFILKRIKIHIAEDKLYFVQKRSLLYFLIVLLLVYFITDNGLNFAAGSWKYDIASGCYLLILADIMLWKEMYSKLDQTGSRLKGAAYIAVVNVGVFLFFLIGNRRLREIFTYIEIFFAREIFSGSSLTVSKVDWVGYRKAAFEAFISNNLTVLDSAYGKERYLYSVYGHGLTSIRFRYGMLPLLLMLLLLIFVVIILWNWNQKDIFLNQCARYLAISYLLKMSAAFILQANMIVSPYTEFPFSGMDIGEIFLPILLVYESCRRTKDVNMQINEVTATEQANP